MKRRSASVRMAMRAPSKRTCESGLPARPHDSIPRLTAVRKGNGRGERIRTSDLTAPNRALYQAELRPDGELASGGPAGRRRISARPGRRRSKRSRR